MSPTAASRNICNMRGSRNARRSSNPCSNLVHATSRCSAARNRPTDRQRTGRCRSPLPNRRQDGPFMPSDHHKPPRQIGGELVIPIIAVGFTLYFFSSVWNSPWTAQVSAFMVGGILLLVCAIFFVRAGMWLVRGEGTLGVGNLFTMISAAMALTGWAVFIWAFDTRFPRGWFETTMQAVMSNG